MFASTWFASVEAATKAPTEAATTPCHSGRDEAVSHLAPPWLDSLKADNGRLLVPLTSANLWGAFLIITRRGSRYPVRFASRTGIIPCMGGRNPDAEARLTAALARADYTAVKSLRRPPEEPDDTCWLRGEGWWLSTAEAEDGLARSRGG